MATAAQVIKAALQRILVQASDAPLEPDEYQDAMFALNNLMLDYDASGISLGYTVVSDLGDQITIPTGALRGLIANLAIEIAPDFGGQVTEPLVAAAVAGKKTMRKLGMATPTSSFPYTLPYGTGNYDQSGYATSRYYPDEEAAILAETTGSISLESGTEDVI